MQASRSASDLFLKKHSRRCGQATMQVSQLTGMGEFLPHGDWGQTASVGSRSQPGPAAPLGAFRAPQVRSTQRPWLLYGVLP